MGDRVAAVRVYQEFARTLARDLELEPTAETVSLIDRVRGPTVVGSPKALNPSAAPFLPAKPALSTEAAAPASAPLQGVHPFGRNRAGATALAVAVIATVVAAPLWLSRPAPAAHPAGSTAEVVAVLPFTVRGTEELAYLQEGMVDLLSVNLAGNGGLRTVNPRTLLSLAARRGGAPALQDPERIRAFAKALGAGSYIAGNVLGLGDRVQLTAVLSPVDPAAGDTLQARVEGPVKDLAGLVDRLTKQLLVGRFRGEGERFASLAASTTFSIEALKSFLEGERYWRARQSDSAVSSFRRAVAYDSGFALAYYRLAVAASWSPAGASGDALDHALRHLDRLPPRNRNLVLAFEARRRAEPARAESLYHVVLQSSPDDGEAWFQLGSLLVHHQILWGRPILQVREALERALALDPNHPRAPGALSWLDGHEGHYGQAAARMQQLLAVDKGEAGPLLRTALAFWQKDAQAQREALAALDRVGDGRELTFITDFVAQRAGDLSGGVQVARALTEPSRSPALRARGYRVTGNLELARGRPRAASAALAKLEQLDPSAGIQVGALTLLNPSFPISRSVAETLRTKLSTWTPPTRPDSARQDYLLGLLASRVGDAATAMRLAQRLVSPAATRAARDSSRDRIRRQDLALSIRADVAWRAGQFSQALSLLEQRHPDVWYPPEMDLVDNERVELEYPFLNQAYERWMRAELLNQLGRSSEALDWYAALGIYPGEEMAYLVPSRLRMGEIYQQLADTAQAVEQYARVVKLWSNSEPELRPRLNQIRSRLAQLSISK
jgi:tetratricopeptide (TPR) repeat protein